MRNSPPTPPEKRPAGGPFTWLGERISDMTPLEQALWALAGVLAIVALAVFVPTLMSDSGARLRGGTPTLFAQAAIPTRLPTLTPIPSATPTLTPSPIPTLEPLTIPSPPSDGMVLTFSPNPDRTGWIGSQELGPHWRDRNLHSGRLQGQAIVSLVQFDLRSLPPGSKILFAALELNGRNARSLGKAGEWKLELVDGQGADRWDEADYDTVVKTKSLSTLGSSLSSSHLAAGATNRFVFTSDQLKLLQNQLDVGTVNLRLQGPAEGSDNLFTWDAGPGPGEPTLYVVTVPASFVVITVTPTPENVYAAATVAARGTEQARQFGTPTPFPRSVATATPGGTNVAQVVVTNVPAPQNQWTATAQAAYATAVAYTTGTFTPTPPNFITVTPTPPFLGITAFTPVPTPIGTPETSLVEYRDILIPPETGLVGNIIFMTDREGSAKPQAWVMDGKGTLLGKLTAQDYHRVAEVHDLFSPDRQYHLDMGKDSQNLWQIVRWDIANGGFVSIIQESQGAKGIGTYHPSWSPDGSKIVFVSERTGYSEIYVLEMWTKVLKKLTKGSTPDPTLGYPPYYKHPSWSPDGSQIVYFSDVGTKPPHNQLWIMNADGSNARVLSPSDFGDYDPVWVKW